MIIDVTTSGSKGKFHLPRLPLVDLIKETPVVLNNIRVAVHSYEDSGWLDLATGLAKFDMDCDTKRLIEEARQEIKKAKDILKKQHPIKYRVHQIIRGFKAIYKAWQLK